MKDMRDPRALGEKLLGDAKTAREAYELPREQAPLSQVYDLHVHYLKIADYDGGGLMSNDPAKHHSRTSQSHLIEGDGGE